MERHGRPRLGLFLAAVVVLLLTPGPAVFYIVTRSFHQGRRAGVVSAAGIAVGTLVHVAAAALGRLGAARDVGASRSRP